MFQKIKPYLQGARELKLDPDFAFSVRTSAENDSGRYKNKKLDKKPEFDGSRRMQGKPKVKSLGALDKPKKRSDKFKR